jgi:parallel beta-helix repeat protein
VDNDGITTWQFGDSIYKERLDIMGNIFYEIGDFAIFLFRTSNSIINNNDIYNCGGGIRLRSTSNSNIIDGNNIYGIDQGIGVYLDRSEKNVISNNYINSSYGGIVMTAPGEFTNNNIEL